MEAQARGVAVVLVAVVGAGLVMLAALWLVTGRAAAPPTPPGQGLAVVPSSADVVGSWKAVTVGGVPVATTASAARADIALIFREDGSFGGDDGCAGFGGRYDVSQSAFTTTNAVTAAVACVGVTSVRLEMFEDGVTIWRSASGLAFYDGAGRELAVYGPS